MTDSDELVKRLDALESKASLLEIKVDCSEKLAAIDRTVALNAQSVETSRLEDKAAIAAQLAELQKAVAVVAQVRTDDSKSLDKQITIYKEQVDKTEKVRLEIYKVLAVIVAVGAVSGLIGYRTILDKVLTHVESEIQPNVSYQTEYMTGSGLLASQNFKAALGHFGECFKVRPYDKDLLLPYLDAIDKAFDVVTGETVITKLRSDLAKYDAIEDPLVWNNIAVVSIDVGSQPQHSEYLAFARDALNRADRKVRKTDKQTQRSINENLWVLNILEGNESAAEKALDELLKLNSADLDKWEVIEKWDLWRPYFEKNPAAKKRAESMWKRLEKARQQPGWIEAPS